MKTKILTLLLIFTVGLFTSCNNDDDATSAQTNTIDTTWNLKNVSGGLVGANIDYATGEVTWTFDSNSETVVIVNTFDVTSPDLQSAYSGLESGTYSFEIIQDGSNEKLVINDFDQGIMVINNGVLTLDTNIAADGFFITFE